MDIQYEHTIEVADYLALRASAGWKTMPDHQALAGIKNSTYFVAAKDGNKTVGMARILSDGGCIANILDVVVLPEYQGNGIGRNLLQMLLSYLHEKLNPGEIININLMAAQGKEGFYKKFGFEERPNDHQGAGMTQWIHKESSEVHS